VVDGTSSQSNATRRNTSGQVSLDLPLASRSKGVLPILGKVTANLNASVTQVSDYGTLGTFGYGLTWIPRDGISLIAAVNEDRSAPTLAQRSGPLVTTQNVRVFDQASGRPCWSRRSRAECRTDGGQSPRVRWARRSSPGRGST
jgi:hypothetical protein